VQVNTETPVWPSRVLGDQKLSVRLHAHMLVHDKLSSNKDVFSKPSLEKWHVGRQRSVLPQTGSGWHVSSEIQQSKYCILFEPV